MSNETKQFEWTDELVMEIIGLTHRAGYHKEPAKVYDRVIQFKQSKLQSQDKPQPSSIDRIEPMPETKYMGSFEAYTSGVSYGVNWCKKYGIPKDLSEITSAKTTQPKEEDKPVIIEDNDRCGICGGEMVYIRGRYPNTDKRKVCPTCTTERLEQISDLCSPEYGKAYQNKN